MSAYHGRVAADGGRAWKMPDPTIPELVARLRELHEKATPGPWSTNHRGGDISARIRGHEVQVALACGQGAMWDERDDAAAIMRANAELIAELRSSLPAILDALDHIGDANKMVDRLPAAGFEVEECGWRRPSQTAQEFHDVDAEKTMPADRRCAMGSKRYTDSDGNECDLPTMCRREPGWAANRIAALLTERQRHAEEVARLEERCQSLEEQLGKLTELYDVTQARLEAFEEQEPDARTCAELHRAVGRCLGLTNCAQDVTEADDDDECDPTAPDAVEMLQRMHACVVLSENHGDVPRVSSDEVLAALWAVQAERARHAEEVAALRAQLRERTRRALNAVLAVLERGTRYTDRHLEAAADSVVEEIREAIALALEVAP